MNKIDVGDVIKKIRMDEGFSLRDVAKDSGISPSALSQIENNKISPNLMTLKKIAKSLNVSVISLLASEEASNISLVKSSDRRKIIRNTTEQGSIIEEFLVDSLNYEMEPAIITLPLNSESGEHVAHDGEEFIFVIYGDIEVDLFGICTYRLQEGDTLYYPCSIPHSFKNVSDGESKFLIVATPPNF